MFRSATSQDIDNLYDLLIDDPRFAAEPARSTLRKNLNSMRKKGRRLDQDVAAQLLVWEKDGKLAGCLINSAIARNAGNEIWQIALLPEFRGQGEGSRMHNALLAHLHPRVDIFARCNPQAQVALQMFLRRGFLPLDSTDAGVQILKLPKMGAPVTGQLQARQDLEAFVEVPV